jgi:hypothetical protein
MRGGEVTKSQIRAGEEGVEGKHRDWKKSTGKGICRKGNLVAGEEKLEVESEETRMREKKRRKRRRNQELGNGLERREREEQKG